MFSAFLNDSVTILHNDGTRHENIPAMVERGKILLDDVSVPISVGERIERLLPSGQNETFSITDVQLTKGMGGIPDFYEIFVQREGARPSSRNQRSVNINVSGSPQAHVNLNSIDSSSNIVNIQASETFQKTRHLIETSVEDVEQRALLLQSVDEMAAAHQSGDFVARYKQFMGLAADHISVLAPIVPILASLL